MRYLIFLALILLLCSFGSLGQTNNTTFDELMASALQSLVVDSSANLGSYRFTLEMEQKIDLVNLSSEEVQKLYTRSFGYGMANMTDSALKLSMASLSYAKGDEDNTSSTAIEEYLINDTLYLKVDGNWTVMKMPGVADAWSAQNTMTQQLEMFNQSRLTLIGSEKVDGVDCYKIRAEIDMGTMADQLSAKVTSLVPMQNLNYSELFRNMALDVHYWITKDTHLLKKTDVTEVFVMTPQSLGLQSNDSEAVEMRINSEVSMLFEGFNESVNVKLPAEAMQAQPFPMGLIASEAEPSVLEGNETMLNETLQNDTMPQNDIAQAAVTA
ncbi:MAG: hypothetical protein QG575_2020 [Euryarchaeota archaeon]|nr:hypothetical protein [Euryarchaeota archaeon]